MREIKFRAWHKADEKMYEVYGFSSSKWFLRGKNFPMPPGAIEVMQYTGIKDRNGKEIYEGDIFENDREDTHEIVTFDEGGFWSVGSTYTSPLHEVNTGSKEIIGNIFEDSDLLEVSE